MTITSVPAPSDLHVTYWQSHAPTIHALLLVRDAQESRPNGCEGLTVEELHAALVAGRESIAELWAERGTEAESLPVLDDFYRHRSEAMARGLVVDGDRLRPIGMEEHIKVTHWIVLDY
jgi:hypothetical protein